MGIVLPILAALLLAISFWEYRTGKVLDIAFIGVLAGRQESKWKLIRIILAQILIWIFSLFLIYVIYEILAKSPYIDFRRIRTSFLIAFVCIIVPGAIIRRWFRAWVTRSEATGKKRSKAG